MENPYKATRLSKLARTLDINISTLVDFFASKGYEIDSNPNTNVNHELFQIAIDHFYTVSKPGVSPTTSYHSEKKLTPIITNKTDFSAITSNTLKQIEKDSQPELNPQRVEKLSGPTIVGKIILPNKTCDKPNRLRGQEELSNYCDSSSSISKNEQSNWTMGKLKFFDVIKGFGFISCLNESMDCFVHVSKIESAIISGNEYVIFKKFPSRKKAGEFEAQNVYEISEFKLNQSFLEEQFCESIGKSWNKTILNNLPPDSLNNILNKKLNNFETDSTLDSVISFLNTIEIFIQSFVDKISDKEVISLIQSWAKKIHNGFLHYQLWVKGYEPLETEFVKGVFKELSSESKEQIIDSIPLPDKLSLLAANYGDIEKEQYYSFFFASVEMLIEEKNFVVFDLEYDGYNINEFAFYVKNVLRCATSKFDVEKLLEKFGFLASKPDAFLVGHNIEEFDIPIIRKRIDLPENIKLLDTLYLETLLSPMMKSFALETRHNAEDDAKHSKSLFINQLIRFIHLPEGKLRQISHFIPNSYLEMILEIRNQFKESSNELDAHFLVERNKFFICKEVSIGKVNELTAFLAEHENDPSIIISPREFFPILIEIPEIQFLDNDSDFSRLISKMKVELLDKQSLERYILLAYIEKCDAERKLPIYANLPGRIKFLINREVSIDLFTDVTNSEEIYSGHICSTPDKIHENLSLVKDSDRKIILIENDLISVTHKVLLKSFDFSIFQERLNHDAFWMYFTGGQSRVEITRKDLEQFNLADIDTAFDYFWIEKNSFDSFQIWGTYNYRLFIERMIGESQVLNFSFSKDIQKKEKCKYVIPNGTNKLSITRYNPETRYRDRYWTYQINLIKKIIQETNRPTVLVINHSEEKPKLYDYFIASGYYVPDQGASLNRQIRLLVDHPSFNKLIIVIKSQIPELVQSDDLDNFNYILDSFELEEKWFISKGTGYLSQIERNEIGLKFKHDDDFNVNDIDIVESDDIAEDKEDETNSNSSSHDIFILLTIQKPIIDYYRWLFSSSDQRSTVWLTDSRLGDFDGLEDEWIATKKYFPLWKVEGDYDKDYQALRPYFISPVPKDEIKIDIAGSKDAMRDIFLREGEIVHQWYGYQEDFLDVILPAEKDILVTLPTGGGKSMLFQAPALYRGSISGRLTIVITPLKALMEDQVNGLWEHKFWASVDYINSDRRDLQYIYRRIAGGEILLLYITPERFRSKSFVNALRMRLENDGGLEYAVYDEAHCVSQWGLDFRPDYLNSANVNKTLKENSHSKFPLLLFSATVSEQIYSDFQLRFDNSINRLENYSKAYNPLREHISVNFEACSDSEEKLHKIVDNLYNDKFNPKVSRCIIFVRTRKESEANIQELERLCNENFGRGKFSGRISYFHAGLNAEERAETYNAFKAGDIYILLATKAFGMGMDIPNIHFVYHYGPSGAIEDFLQEVGRAGRNKAMLKAAGYSNDKPIQAKCFLDKKNDFKRIKDLLQDGRLTWTNLTSVYKNIIVYYDRFRDFDLQSEESIVLPFNLLSQSPLFDDINDKEQIMRLSLYWLEKLKRIRLGFYAPSQLEFTELKYPDDKIIENRKQRALIDAISVVWNSKPQSASSVAIELNSLLRATGESNASELLKIIFYCQKNEILRFNNEVIIYPTKKKKDELMYYASAFFEGSYPMLDAVFDLAFQLMELTTEKEQYQFESGVLEDLIKEIAGEHFNKNSLPWMRITSAGKESIDKERIQKEQKEFVTNKTKFAFAITDFVPKVRYRSLIKHKTGQRPDVIQVIYNGCKKKEEWESFIKDFKKDLISLLKFTISQYLKGKKRHNIADVILELELHQKDQDYIENLFSMAKWLGYVHYEGSILPMGVELYLISRKDIDSENPNSKDKLTNEEFLTTQKLRELRLIALECLAEISKGKDQNEFITKYFNCNNIDEIIELIIDYFGEDSKMISSFREIALKQAVYGEQDDAGNKKSGLSDEQLDVYNADLSSNIQVLAGPGSGKTHTLILRVARLIHEENVKPENILVLAYNRAVVVELKERLTKLFSALGYGNYVKRLKVFTFSGFCKFCLRENLQDIPVKDWEKEFVNIYAKQPGSINIYLGNIKFVFVDEFQDITEDRLRLLKQIANVDYAKITVIGDPNQSIYGFERVEAGGCRSPKGYYEKFEKHYKPTVLRINDNFRSYPKILNAAEKIICYNQDRFEFEHLRPIHKADHEYLEVIECEGIDDSWIAKLNTLLDEENPNTKAQYRQIALMFRRNVEIYRAYNIIEQKKRSNNWDIRIRIQGENEDYSRTREIAWLLDNFFRPKSNSKLSTEIVSEFENYVIGLKKQFPSWDEYYYSLFGCLLIEFLKNIDTDSTYMDLIDFVEELARKDDGQLSKIYYFNHSPDASQNQTTEIVLTTMHKVKGLEFDAVIIPASFTDLPFIFFEEADPGSEEFQELIEEERRLLYVAYTRAKYRLVAYYGDRERALIKGQSYSFPEEIIKDLGVSVKPGLNKYFISWGATDTGNSVFEKIEKTLKFGAKISLKKHTNNWFLYWKDLKIGCLSGPASKTISNSINGCGCNEIKGYRVSNIFKWTFSETQEYDQRNGSDFEKHWSQEAKMRGYIYLIEFSGYGKPQ